MYTLSKHASMSRATPNDVILPREEHHGITLRCPEIQTHDRLGCCTDQAYKRAALRYHPDKASAEEREEAEKKFKQVNAANVILSDPAKRQRYDAGELMHMPLWDCPPPSVCNAGNQYGCGVGALNAR